MTARDKDRRPGADAPVEQVASDRTVRDFERRGTHRTLDVEVQSLQSQPFFDRAEGLRTLPMGYAGAPELVPEQEPVCESAPSPITEAGGMALVGRRRIVLPPRGAGREQEALRAAPASDLAPPASDLAPSASDLAPPPPLPIGLATAPPSTRGPLTPLDEALLATLDEAFMRHASADGELGAEELRRALGLQSRMLAERLLKVFDRDGDGVVTRAEFVERVRRLLYGGSTDKLRFAFRIHDLDGDNRISRQETLTMIRASLLEEGLREGSLDPENLTDLVFREADRNGDGFISYREFEEAVKCHPAILQMITRCEACWIAPGGELLEGRPVAPAWRRRVQRLVSNRGPAIIALCVWLSLNVILGVRAALHYQALGANGYVMLARAGGACLNFNGALILIPVMRRLLTWVRSRSALAFLPVDDALGFHRLVGHTMFAMGLVHTVAHLLNYQASGFGVSAGLLTTSAGLSGLLLLIVFAVMWGCSLPQVRQTRRFELFYFTHLLYGAWLVLCLLHGPVFYLWVSVPLLGFAIEQVLRRTSGSYWTEATALVPMSSGVTRLTMKRPVGFRHQPGDYGFIRLPILARHEWHPFTISSAPERDEITMHVRSLGNFTRALRDFAERRRTKERHSGAPLKPVQIQLEGPYGTPSGHIFSSPNVVLVGAGIGVTPFAAVLESIVLRAKEGSPGPRKVHFFWLSRDAYSFEWFAELLLKLEEIDTEGLVDLHIYMTGGRGHVTSTALNLARSIAHQLGRPDLITGLRAKTNVGKPDFHAELTKIRALSPGEPVDLFFCGPGGLGQSIAKTCRDLGIRFRQERF